MRIIINGVPGVGKTTFSELLAEKLGLPFVTERFENNPYLPGGAAADITSFQLQNQLEDYNNNKIGVFDQSPQASRYIYLTGEEREQVPELILKYDIEVNLFAPFTTIRNRIIRRNRVSFVSIELEQLEQRFEGYQRFVVTRPIESFLLADGSPQEMLDTFLKTHYH